MATNLDLYSTRQATNKLAQDGISLETGDIEIGAVEIKDGSTDQRATVNASGELLVASASSTSALQALAQSATGTDAYATVLTAGAKASNIMITLEGADDAIISLDGGTTDGVFIKAGTVTHLAGVNIAASALIQAKNAIAGSNYSNLTITIW